jgi:hypothetical protein
MMKFWIIDDSIINSLICSQVNIRNNFWKFWKIPTYHAKESERNSKHINFINLYSANCNILLFFIAESKPQKINNY